MNVYDFDKTIFPKDCAQEFFKKCLIKDRSLLKLLPKLSISYLRFKLGRIDRTTLKESLYAYVCQVDNLEEKVNQFWDEHEHEIAKWYLKQKKDDDLVISASPNFLIEPICNRLGIDFIASPLDVTTGKYNGKNTYGIEKVTAFRKRFPYQIVDEFYSDSLSDTPMAKLANQAYLVTSKSIQTWPTKALLSSKNWE